MDKMYISLSVLVAMASENVFADGPPRRVAPDGHPITFAHVNESITLRCPVESESESQTFVEWTRGNASLYLAQGFEITRKGFLKIKSVAHHHSGVYTCEAVNGYGAVRVNLTLLVDNPEIEIKNYTISNRNSANRVHSLPPSIVSRPSSSSVEAGGEATFHCIASGQPLPHIFWLRDGHLVQGSTSYVSKRRTHSTLRLKALRKADAGDYKCIARNKLGDDETDYSLHITEPSPPPRIIALDPPNVTIREGSTITFVCEVASRPGVQLHIKWLKRQEETGQSLESRDVNLFRSGRMYYRPLNFTDSEFASNGGTYKSKLLIRNSCEADSGTYVCLALNDKGFNFRNSTLKVIGRTAALANRSPFPASTPSLAVTITVAAVAIFAAVVFVSHLCRRNKLGDKTRKAVETGHDAPSIRISHKGDLDPFPETTSKLLGMDPAHICEPQMSKSIQERTSFH